MISQGVNVIGDVHGSLGLSEHCRSVVASLEKQNIPYSLIPVSLYPFAFSQGVDFTYPVNLFCIDQPQILPCISHYGWDKFKNKYSIANIFWETNYVPKHRRVFWKFVDEIWVNSKYIQENIAAVTSLPVFCFNQPVQLPLQSNHASKSSFGLNESFTFLFCFAFCSVVTRKNPAAVIQAFQKAFPSRQDVQLVIKSQHGEKLNARAYREHLEMAKGDSRIKWIDETMSSQRRYELMNACDCYISLHRSEGFGLTMAEAMLLGKPVIATGYSGNLDFMNEENSFLCPYMLKPIGKGHGLYPAAGMWSEPDVEQAAFWMDYVVNNPQEVATKAQKGKEWVLKHHSFEHVGKQIGKRLNDIQLPQSSKRVPFKYLSHKVITTIDKQLRNLLRPVKRKIYKLLSLPREAS